jgi:hypothetical protein
LAEVLAIDPEHSEVLGRLGLFEKKSCSWAGWPRSISGVNKRTAQSSSVEEQVFREIEYLETQGGGRKQGGKRRCRCPCLAPTVLVSHCQLYSDMTLMIFRGSSHNERRGKDRDTNGTHLWPTPGSQRVEVQVDAGDRIFLSRHRFRPSELRLQPFPFINVYTWF